MKTQTKNLIIIAAVAAITIITTIAAILIFSGGNEIAESPQTLLDLGEQYLLELDYEQALVQFLRVIEIEPMNARAYIGAAESYIGLGDTDNAIAILEQGYEQTSDSEIKRILDELTFVPEIEPEPESEPDPEPEHEHTWQLATCTEPQNCIDCGEAEGEPTPHNWLEATCQAPKTCTDCGGTEGMLAPHAWREATYEEPITCAECGITEGNPLTRPVVTATAPPVTTTVPPVTTTPPPVATPINERVGEIIQFGGYDWRILDIQDGKALLISDKILENRAYHNKRVDTWADSDLRAYLNDEFYNSFSAKDRARIAEVTNTNPDNQWFGTPGGANTQDRIFLLSLDEVVKYFGDSGQLANRPSEYVRQIDDQYNENRVAYHVGGTYYYGNIWQDTYTVGAGDPRAWWLRSPGGISYYAASVGGSGLIYSYGSDVIINEYGVRPALWLNL